MAHERGLLAGQDSCFSERSVSGSGSGTGGATQKRRSHNGDAQPTSGSCYRPDSSKAGERSGDTTVAVLAAEGPSPAEGQGRSAGCHLPRRHERQHVQQQHQRLGGREHARLIEPRLAVQRSTASRPIEFEPEAGGVQTAGGGGATTTNDEHWRAKVRCRMFLYGRRTKGRL